jgi:hypothetical protein
MPKTRKDHPNEAQIGGRDTGYTVKANVTEHGYKFKLVAEFDYAAMTDKQLQSAHKVLYDVLTEALVVAQNMRAINVPLFDLDDITPKRQQGEGINER